MTQTPATRVVHLRLSARSLLSILRLMGSSATTVSGSVADFCSLMTTELEKQQVVPPTPVDETEVARQLKQILFDLNLAVPTEDDYQLQTRSFPSDENPRDVLRDMISQAEQQVVNVQAETSHYDFEHGPGYESVEAASRGVENPLLDLDNIAKLPWDEILSEAPLDRLVVEAETKDDNVMRLSVAIVYRALDHNSWGSDNALRLVKQIYPEVKRALDSIEKSG